ncbi:MAG TPA: protein kinase [Blastocatellia bacterium]|nr:protein kinase [Blastocatellia bacterium]
MNICMSCGSPVPSSDEECPRCGAVSRNRQDRLLGITLADKYLIEEKLGAGGMCEVYRARHVLINKPVAVKVLRPELASDPQIARRFEQEAKAASLIRHPNAIDVTDFGLARGNTPFIVMELVEGRTVGELLRQEGVFSVERTMNILRQICGALESAHAAGVIHRDIKPDNIIIAEYEGGDWVEVCDFGVAKIQEDVNRRAALTGANLIIGTPRYMSPEQCEERPVDARSDIYSLGVVLYEMLAGEAPFGGNSTRQMIAHAVETPPPLRLKRPDLSPELEAVIMRALEKDPARRPQSAPELFQAFEAAASPSRAVPLEARSAGEGPGLSIPLTPNQDYLLTPAAAEAVGLDDEATLVRSRERSEDYAPAGAPPLPHDRRGGITHPGNVQTQSPRVASHRTTGAGREARRKPNPLMIGIILGALVLSALAAVLVLRDRRAGESTVTAEREPEREASAQRPSTAAAPAAPAPTPIPKIEDNVDSTPESVESVPPAEGNVDTSDAEDDVPPPPEVDQAAIRRQVIGVLNGWTSSLSKRNLNAHLRYFAPSLHTYYLKRGVNRSYVRGDIARALDTYSKLDFSFGNISVRPDRTGKRAVATFTKMWDFEGEKNVSGSVQERVWLENVSGNWRITGVRDLRVNYVQQN